MLCPEPVVGVSAEGAPNSAAISWVVNSDGAAPEGFYIQVSGPDGFTKTVAMTAPATTTEVAGLKNGVEYSFTVIAATRDGSAAPSESVTATPTTGMEGVVGGVIVEFTPGNEKTQGETEVPGKERVTDVDLTVGEKVADDAVLVELSEPVDVDTATRIADELEADPQVEWAEPDQFFFTSNESDGSVQDPTLAQTVSVPADSDYAGSQWNLWDDYGISVGDGNQSMTDAWVGPRGDGVNVAVIDTGVTPHPDLDGQLVDGYDFVSNPEKLAAVRQANAPPVAFDGDYIDEATYGALGRDDNPTDPGDWRGISPARNSSWHGTKITGIIAAADNADGITGVAPNSKIQPVRALSWRGGLLSDIAASITWASGGEIDNVPANGNPSKVINMSFSVETMCPTALQKAIDGARDRGAILVAAAGNASDDAAKFAPGNCNGVITVAASNRDGQRADYSNYGPTIDISAPGGDASNPITTISNIGVQQPDAVTAATTGSDSGTSVAAAHVSAAAAILASRDASLTPDQAYQQLTGHEYTKSFANDTCDAANPDYSCGTGILSLAQVASTACTENTSGTDPFVVKFTLTTDENSCTSLWNVPAEVTEIDYLVVAGGGGGGAGFYEEGSLRGGGGGGAGGLREGTQAVEPGQELNILVGKGGAGGVDTAAGGRGERGFDSALRSLDTQPKFQFFATSGQQGNAYLAGPSSGTNGSGGGGSPGSWTGPFTGGSGGTGGNDGGSVTAGAVSDSLTNAAGGGGAGAPGEDTDGEGPAGAGGAGLESDITGTPTFYAGGGGGGGSSGGAGGAGGGGTGGTSGQDGQDGFGGGGGGGWGSGTSPAAGGDGGNGVVIIRYSLKEDQAPLDIQLGSSTLVFAETTTVTVTGGSGDGAISFDDPTGDCSIASTSGNVATVEADSGTGTCSVGVTKAGDDTYREQTGTSPTITLAKAEQPTAVTVTSAADPVTYNQTTEVTASGGSTTSDFTFSASGGCEVESSATPKATIRMTSGSTDCTVEATRGSDDDYKARSGEVTIETAKASQPDFKVTTSPFTTPPITLPIDQSLTLGFTGQLGTGDVEFTLDSGSCTLTDGDVVTLTASAATGTCEVTGTAPEDNNYEAQSSLVEVTLAPAPTITIVQTGGADEDSGWAESGGVITAWQDVSIDASEVNSALDSGDVTVSSPGSGGQVKVASDASISPSEANSLTFETDTVTVEGSISLSDSGSSVIFDAAPNDFSGTVSNSGSITAGSMLVRNVHMAVFTSGTVNVGTLAAVGGHRLLLTDEDALTIGTVDGVAGISDYTEWIIVSTKDGNLTVAQPVGTSAESNSYRLRLSAGTDATFGTASGGDVIVSGSGAINVPDAVTQIFSGTAANTDLGDIATTAVVAREAPSVEPGQVAVAYRSGPPVFVSPNSMRFGETMQLVATDPLGGSITFSLVDEDDPCTVTGSSVEATGVGDCVVKATASQSTNQTIEVAKASQAAAFTSTIPTRVVSGTEYEPAAEATSGLDVAFSITEGDGSVCELVAGIVTFTDSGTCTVAADQAGNTNYEAATRVTQTLVTGKINQTITFAQPEAKTVESPAFTLEASVNSGRSVTFATSPSPSTVCAVGETSGIVSILGPGECVITASSPGTGSYADAPEVTRSFTVSAVAPGVPSLDSVSGDDGTMTIGFVPPGNNGGSEITGYEAIATPTGGGDPEVQQCGPVSPCVMGGLDEDLEYEVTLRPINGAGIGETASDPSPALTPSASNEGAVSDLRTTNGDGEMTVNWAEPLSFGNGTFQKYQVFIRESGTEGWPTDPAKEFGDLSTESTTLSDLVNGTSYDVKIVVVTDPVAQEPKETISLGVAATVPDPPTDLTVEVLSMTSVLASWTAPAYNGGSAITGYPLSPSCVPENPTDTFCVITGLTPGSTVTVRVAASNVVGTSSTVAEAVTLPALPSPSSDGGGGDAGSGAGGEPPANPVTMPEGIRNGSVTAAVTVDGATVPIQILENPTSGQMQMLGPDFLLRVETADQAGVPIPMTDSRWLRAPQGGRVNASGDGYLADSSVRVFLVPREPIRIMGLTGRAATGAIYLGDASASDAGSFSASFLIPLSVSVGDYVLQINGVSRGDQVRSANMQLEVIPGVAPLEFGKTQRAGFFKGTSDEFSKAGRRKLRSLVRALPSDAQAVQVLIGGVSVSLDSFEANVTLAGKRASKLAGELRDRGVSGEFVVNVTSTFTVDAAERSLAEKADVLTTKAGKPLSTVTILFQEPVGS